MFDVDLDDLRALDDLDDITDGLDDLSSRTDRNSIYQTVASVMQRETESNVEPLARRLARRYVGDDAGQIDATSVGWRGDTFVTGLDTDSEVVLAHEFGSGVHGDGTPYRISGGDEPLSFEVNGEQVVVEFVVHPGVEGKHFMRRAARRGADEIADELDEELFETARDALE